MEAGGWCARSRLNPAVQQWCAQPGAAVGGEDGIPGPERQRRDELFTPLEEAAVRRS